MATVRKKTVKRPTSRAKTHGIKKQASAPKKKTTSRRVLHRTEHVTIHHKEIIGDTYVFECTRPGCGYRLYHDERHEPGQVRLDLKCPKCHNYGFKCLGKGDVPETFHIPINPEPLDFNSINSTELGSST